MRDFLLGVLVMSVLAAIGLGGFGVYSYVTLDNRVGELSDRLNSKLEELTQQVEELQEHQLLVPYRVFIPPQIEVSNIEKLEASISFKVWNDFSIPAISVSPFPAQATVEITDPYLEGGIEVRAVTVIDAGGNILVKNEPIPVAEATIIEIEPTP